MAGTLFGLPLSQPIDLNGRPQVGCKLYIYSAGSFTTPATAYKDYGLTVGQEHPNPIPSDAWGRLPIFWLADGAYAFRLVDENGTVLASSLTVQALGPSSGSGGGSSVVDPNALIQTGDVIWLDVTGARAGFVRDNGRTIGSATSGASERANADCSALYTFLWTNYSDTICPVSTGRGANAAADFSANKAIQLPDKRGRAPFGLDDMGNGAASRFAGVPFSLGNATTPGSLGGEATHTLTLAESPAHTHALTDPGHVHSNPYTNNASGTGGDTKPTAGNGSGFIGTFNSSSATTGISMASAGSGNTHNNTPLFVTGTFYRKL